MAEALTEPGWWSCQHGHTFKWGDEDWHAEASQSGSRAEDGLAPYGAPTHCPCEWPEGTEHARKYGVGDPCVDSSILAGPCATPEEAREFAMRSRRFMGYQSEWVEAPT